MAKSMHNIDLSREDGHQYAVMLWSQQAPIREQWPELALLHHVENERQCTPQQGARRKRMGVKPGVPDLDLPVARGGYHGLRIELKTETGGTSNDQRWWCEQLNQQGYFATTCHGWKSAVRTIQWYLSLPKDVTNQ